MSEIGPIGLDAIAAAASRWVSWSWIVAPVMLLSIAAFALRYRLARRSMQRFDAHGAGPWIDGRVCVRGTLAVSAPERAEELLAIARYSRQKKATDPEFVRSSAELRVLLQDGRSIRIAAGTSVKFRLSSLQPESASRKLTHSEGSGDSAIETYAITAANGAPVWLVAHVDVAAGDAPLRASAQLELARLDEVELHFESPRAPETRIDGSYSLLWLSTIVGALLAFSDGWIVVFAPLEVLFGALAVSSLRSTLRYRRALESSSPSPQR